MKKQEELPVFLVRIIDENDFTIEKEISSDNEYHALLTFALEVNSHFRLRYETGQYIVSAVVQVDK